MAIKYIDIFYAVKNHLQMVLGLLGNNVREANYSLLFYKIDIKILVW